MCSEKLIQKRKDHEESNARSFSRIMIACRCIFFVTAAAIYAVFLISNYDKEFNSDDYTFWTISCIAGLASVFLFQLIILIYFLKKLMIYSAYKESYLELVYIGCPPVYL